MYEIIIVKAKQYTSSHLSMILKSIWNKFKMVCFVGRKVSKKSYYDHFDNQ